MEFTDTEWNILTGEYQAKLVRELNSQPTKDIGPESNPIVEGMILKCITPSAKNIESFKIVDSVKPNGTIYVKSLFDAVGRYFTNIDDCRRLYKIVHDPRDMDRAVTMEWNYIKEILCDVIKSESNIESITLEVHIRYLKNVERVRNLGYLVKESDEIDHGYLISLPISDSDLQELINKLNSTLLDSEVTHD